MLNSEGLFQKNGLYIWYKKNGSVKPLLFLHTLIENFEIDFSWQVNWQDILCHSCVEVAKES